MNTSQCVGGIQSNDISHVFTLVFNNKHFQLLQIELGEKPPAKVEHPPFTNQVYLPQPLEVRGASKQGI